MSLPSFSALQLWKNHHYPAHHPHYTSPLKQRRARESSQHSPSKSFIQRSDVTITFSIWTTIFLFPLFAVWSNISLKDSHKTKGQLCLCLDRPFLLPLPPPSVRLSTPADQGPGSPVITVCLDTHHWLSIRASVSCDPQHRDFKELLTGSVVPTWLVTVLFKDNVTLKHPQTAECLQSCRRDKWPQEQC